ncbi:enoyl-CoA hydratase [Altererythrobacter gangjinensis]|uniref:Enoyl-CoA hydratase n=2 Tax=Pontixanthobacter gangjinensis TaxID=1028742 RepID=A0A6I4SMG5_9SPHN|nr:enoyl-CoA hydratase [Pontixanthobacter gangjinensis]
MVFGSGDEHMLESPATLNKIPEELLALKELDVLYQEDTQALWTYMRPKGRPSFTPPMLGDFESWQKNIAKGFGPGKLPLKYLILGSRAPGVFCFGGDLTLFQDLIRNQDRKGLEMYGHRCCKILHRNMNSLNLPMLTIGLVEGAALGGGFEALLSFDHVVAERGATFGLPEIMFGLFPGMGAHAFLYRKLGAAAAQRLILSNETFTAEQMFDLGLVHQLAENGQGLHACRDYIKKSDRRHAGLVNARRAMKAAWKLELAELTEITELWADAALQVSERDLKVMCRLASAQQKLADAA